MRIEARDTRLTPGAVRATDTTSGGALPLLRLLVNATDPRSFDEAHEMMPDMLRQVHAEMERQAPHKAHYTLILYGGYSERAGRYMGYILSTRPEPDLAIDPFVPEVCRLYSKPLCSPEAYAAFGFRTAAGSTMFLRTTRRPTG